jgi:hypothetical protein
MEESLPWHDQINQQHAMTNNQKAITYQTFDFRVYYSSNSG